MQLFILLFDPPFHLLINAFTVAPYTVLPSAVASISYCCLLLLPSAAAVCCYCCLLLPPSAVAAVRCCCCLLLPPSAVAAACCRCCLLLPPSTVSGPDSGTCPSRPERGTRPSQPGSGTGPSWPGSGTGPSRPGNGARPSGPASSAHLSLSPRALGPHSVVKFASSFISGTRTRRTAVAIHKVSELPAQPPEAGRPFRRALTLAAIVPNQGRASSVVGNAGETAVIDEGLSLFSLPLFYFYHPTQTNFQLFLIEDGTREQNDGQ